MKENVGSIDRLVRFVVGPALIVLGATRRNKLPAMAAIAAGAMITESAITRVCPASKALGLDTRTASERERDMRALMAS